MNIAWSATDFDMASLSTQDEPKGTPSFQKPSDTDWGVESNVDMADDNARKYTEAEEAALKLVGVLHQLRTQATSYETATKTLNGIRQHLIGLIQSAAKTAYESQKALQVICENGGPETLKRLSELEAKMTKEFVSVSKRSRNLNILIRVTLACAVSSTIISLLVLAK
ncbi:MAG: hypothetical protein PHV74_06160 [Dehalococcoidia bacterium]|nr:hypothetical protein [Dehalococcoidia bacterium]